MNIILDSLRKYQQELYLNDPAGLSFRRLVILPRDLAQAQPDCLYVGRLTDVMRAKNQITGFCCCICLRDRIKDSRENEETLTGLVIINENMDLAELFSEIQETFVRINEWYQSMQDAVIRQKSLQDILTLSEGVLGNFISISDSALTLVAYTKNITTDDPTSTFLVENGYHSDEAVRKFKQNKRFETWLNADELIISTDGKISKYVIISKAFVFNDTYFMHVVMSCNHREMTPGLIDLFNHMIDILSHYIKRNWEEKKDYDHVYSSLIIDLLQEKITADKLGERARMVGIRPEEGYVVMLLTGGGTTSAAFPALVAQDITRKFPRIRAVYYNCRLMLFLHHTDIETYMAGEAMLAGLNAYFTENGIYCGMSDAFNDLLELSEAYIQAELALDESNAGFRNEGLLWEPERHYSNIAPFDAYFIGCLLNREKKSEKLWKNSKYGRLLLKLASSDIEKNTNNLEVLSAYLINERRATETATALHMHRNNVVYRVSRIEEMLNIRLDDTKTRLNLTLSLFMFRNTGLYMEYIKHVPIFGAGE